MNKEKLQKELFELYEKLERDKDLYKEFIQDENKFLEARGYKPDEVRSFFKSVTEERSSILKDVLQEQTKKF
tara:strand:+ start:387 stop:602 length:216 start_codon:yes stop_codon:yes gene_type:complete